MSGDSKQLLQLEQNIKEIVAQKNTNNCFIILAALATKGYQEDQSSSFLSAVVLKNSLKNHTVDLQQAGSTKDELQNVRTLLLLEIVHSSSMFNKKHFKELVVILSYQLTQEFFLDQENCSFLNTLVNVYS